MDVGLVAQAAFLGTAFFTGGIFSLILAVIVSRLVGFAFQKYVIGRAPAPPKAAVIITGCSSGIGLAAAIHLASEGLTVFAAVRKEEDFKVFKKNSRIIPLILDVTKEKEIKDAVTFITGKVEKENYKLLGLVNNAGYAESGVMELLPVDKLRKQLDVNVVGQVAMTQAFLPLLRKYGEQTLRPRVVFISSGLGLITLPNLGAYAASKHAIEAVGDAFRMELQAWKIPVVVIQPGSIKTNFISVVRETTRENNASHGEQDELTKHYSKRTAVMMEKQIVLEKLYSTTQATNEAIEGALLDKKPKARYQCGLDCEYGASIFAFFPEIVFNNVFGRFFQ